MRKLITLGLLFSLLLLAALFAPTTAETSTTTAEAPAQQTNTEFQYAAKFVCGRNDSPIAASGQYFTIVNVHNPSPLRTVEFRKKFARALPGEEAGRITPFFQAALRPDEAMGIDCPDIYQHTNIPHGTFIEGYVVLHTPMELDVVSVYTAGTPNVETPAGTPNVETLHTERVPPRRVPLPPPQPPECGPLMTNLDTGTADWHITQDPIPNTTESRPATVLTAPSPAWASQAGAQWIGPTTNAAIDAPEGDYTYQLCFCLCSGFRDAQLTLTGLADNIANVFFNNVPLTPTIPGFSGTPTTVVNNKVPFQAGTNCLRIVVRNGGGPTGLNIRGTLKANLGLCSKVRAVPIGAK